MVCYSESLKIFRNLVGVWGLERTLEGKGVLNERATFKGKAKYTLVEEGVILYREEGVLLSGDHEQEGYRQYYYTYDTEGDQIRKWFDWGDDKSSKRLFHELSFSDNFSEAYGEHVCGDDFYKVRYEFRDGVIHSMLYQSKSNESQESSRVKNYVIKTVFSPEST